MFSFIFSFPSQHAVFLAHCVLFDVACICVEVIIVVLPTSRTLNDQKPKLPNLNPRPCTRNAHNHSNARNSLKTTSLHLQSLCPNPLRKPKAPNPRRLVPDAFGAGDSGIRAEDFRIQQFPSPRARRFVQGLGISWLQGMTALDTA